MKEAVDLERGLYADKRNEAEKKIKPNFLIIMVDEQRFPPPYEDDSIKEWREKYLQAQNFLRQNGVEFKNHYTGSTACSPSRATLYTGQYPSLHGVTQTDGGGDTAFSPDLFWLDPNTVPTFGEYLRTSGYSTFWKGKWHASHPDIQIPGTHDSYTSFDEKTGVPISEREEIYFNANRLSEYGFDGWIGPEPHGSDPHNSGASAAIGVSGRDEIYSTEVINLIKRLQNKRMEDNDSCNPWAIVASFVNPHDIALFGAITKLYPAFNFDIDESIPSVPPSPTARERLDTKPKAQSSYCRVYQEMLQPLADNEEYRRLYYSLQLKVDREIYKVITALCDSIFYDDTIIIYTSDHGDMLGAHGGLFQKWYAAYEEATHVPLIFHNPKLIPESKSVDILTSHVDILPTMLELARIDFKRAARALRKSHTEVHPLVGKSLAPLILNHETNMHINEPVYFMTDDDPSRTFVKNFFGKQINPVTEPCHLETIIVKMPTGTAGGLETWKYSRYFDNPQFWSNPGEEDKSNRKECSVSMNETGSFGVCIESIKTEPSQDEIEMYNLTLDPIEARNLASPEYSTQESQVIQILLAKLLAEQCHRKRIYPANGTVPGKPSCRKVGNEFLNL